MSEKGEPLRSELRIETFTLPAADLGPENPLPVIEKAADLHSDIKTDETFPREDLENLGWGRPPTLLPYRYQDSFNRERKPRAFKSVVLENEHLRATFIPELGGHLWSLFSKDSNAELLASNPVFQPCNLAIRKAWISGGIEWNFGWCGHWPLTCAPLFAARRTLPDGTPALRMWEFERVRRMTVQIDAWLPPGSKALFVRSAIHNPNDHMVPVYWWTNIAARQNPGTRVLVSADETLLHNYTTHAMGACRLPDCDGDEITYPGRMRGARDFFFRVPDSETHPWEIALQPDCHGLFQTSTSRLRGRKLFRWGIQSGGQTWQRYLGTPDYLEIQAGLARSQSHHLPMPAGETWSWVEAFGEVVLGEAAFGNDWPSARAEGDKAVRAIVPGGMLDRLGEESGLWADIPVAPDEIIAQGSGWGALECERRAGSGTAFPGTPGIAFPPDSCTVVQNPWRTLLRGGVIAERPVEEEPGEFAPQEFIPLLEASFARSGGRNWLSLFHYGVMLWEAGRNEEALSAWRDSCAAKENAWARRCVGIARRLAGDKLGRDDLLRANGELPAEGNIRREALAALVEDGEYAAALAFEAQLDDAARAASRIRLLRAVALVATGRLDEAESIILSTPPAADMREGESSFSALWIEIQARRAGLVADGVRLTSAQIAELAKRFVPPAAIDYML